MTEVFLTHCAEKAYQNTKLRQQQFISMENSNDLGQIVYWIWISRAKYCYYHFKKSMKVK